MSSVMASLLVFLCIWLSKFSKNMLELYWGVICRLYLTLISYIFDKKGIKMVINYIFSFVTPSII